MSAMNYRPITDTWILGRCKHGYFGGYPVGYLERIREFLPVLDGKDILPDERIWHFCSGRVQDYKGKIGGIPLKGFTKFDRTFDINPKVKPDYVMDLRTLKSWQIGVKSLRHWRNDPTGWAVAWGAKANQQLGRPRAIAIDRPYDEANHNEYVKRYGCPPNTLPDLNELLRESLRIVMPGGRVAVLDWIYPNPGSEFKCTAAISVVEGFNKRARIATVWKKR